MMWFLELFVGWRLQFLFYDVVCGQMCVGFGRGVFFLVCCFLLEVRVVFMVSVWLSCFDWFVLWFFCVFGCLCVRQIGRLMKSSLFMRLLMIVGSLFQIRQFYMVKFVFISSLDGNRNMLMMECLNFMQKKSMMGSYIVMIFLIVLFEIIVSMIFVEIIQLYRMLWMKRVSMFVVL